VAVLIVGATVIALVVATLSPAGTAPAAASAAPTATPTTAARPTTDLSATGRLAYWRNEANGDYLLWLANADNSRRRSVAKADPAAVTRTKWSADGSAIAYVESGVRLVVVHVDGVTATFTLAPELRTDGYRIVDHRFSPSGARVAATVQRVSGSQSDVYVSGPGNGWTRLTTTEDALAADWISEDELLVQTTGGIVGRLRAAGRDQLRPLTGLQSATPIIGDDGRIYFLSGRVNGFAGSNETLVFAASASVWSATVDGEDLRREPVALELDSFRIDGLWPGGFLLHRGTNPAQVAFAKSNVDLPTNAGLIERLSVSADRRFAVGFAGSNLVRVDMTSTGTATNATVLLGSVSQGDAWFPRNAALTRITPAKADVPAARYVFALGGHLWTMGGDGGPSLLRAGNLNSQTLRRFPTLSPPQWSPTGDRVLTVESLAPGASAFQLIAVTISRDGTVKRYNAPSSIGQLPTWSPDGTHIALVAFPAAKDDPVVLSSDLSVLLVEAASSTTKGTVPGREAFWTKAGLIVLNNGAWRVGDRARDAQAIEVWNGGQKRELATIAKLIADPRAQAPAQTRGLTQTSALTASPDGGHFSVHVAFLGPTTTITFAIFRSRDGSPSAVVTGDAVNDESWASTGRFIGYTLTSTQPGGGTRPRAVVRDAETGDVVLEQDGRFAGWSPDGLWIYTSRAEGLYARRVSGGEAVRFSPYGVAVSATKP
jgi:Tol biopolymer transport system component